MQSERHSQCAENIDDDGVLCGEITEIVEFSTATSVSLLAEAI